MIKYGKRYNRTETYLTKAEFNELMHSSPYRFYKYDEVYNQVVFNESGSNVYLFIEIGIEKKSNVIKSYINKVMRDEQRLLESGLNDPVYNHSVSVLKNIKEYVDLVSRVGKI